MFNYYLLMSLVKFFGIITYFTFDGIIITITSSACSLQQNGERPTLNGTYVVIPKCYCLTEDMSEICTYCISFFKRFN